MESRFCLIVSQTSAHWGIWTVARCQPLPTITVSIWELLSLWLPSISALGILLNCLNATRKTQESFTTLHLADEYEEGGTWSIFAVWIKIQMKLHWTWSVCSRPMKSVEVTLKLACPALHWTKDYNTSTWSAFKCLFNAFRYMWRPEDYILKKKNSSKFSFFRGSDSKPIRN